jgi:hypothetical protein
MEVETKKVTLKAFLRIQAELKLESFRLFISDAEWKKSGNSWITLRDEAPENCIVQSWFLSQDGFL